ncbi:MAG TPA: prepilin-type N-terminal cleavage/methylation domain-containing protein [Pyrinomonadaceae bacterium]|jgi:type II secretory pathway pseudopilin PulG
MVRHQTQAKRAAAAAGFSLLELIIAMTILMIALTAATTLLTSSLSTRTRENQRTDALADAQRALNIMSRDIANAGFGLVNVNGLVVADSSATSIRIRANIHNDVASDPVDPATGNPLLATNDQDEDLIYVFQANNAAIVRWDNNIAANRAVLASNISDLQISYLDGAGNAVAIANAVRVRVDVRVNLPATTQGQPDTLVRLSSDIALRNAPTMVDQY